MTWNSVLGFENDFAIQLVNCKEDKTIEKINQISKDDPNLFNNP